MRRLASLFATLALAGCATAPLPPPTKTTALCRVLIEPYPYSSTTNKHNRFAGSDLVPRLKRHNQVWTSLHCMPTKE